jgi:CMP/dCMP kinase
VIVAVDGPAASGKGTLARRLARQFGLAYLDTGLLYRAVGMAVLRAGGDPENESAAVAAARTLDPTQLEDPELREDAAAKAASQVAKIPAVRRELLEFQRNFANTPPGGAAGAVLDGRDIGTVVCPKADAKLFVVATLEARAARRLKELRERGVEAIHSRVLEDMQERDARDSKRAVSPLVPAADAFVLDTTELDADAAFAQALDYINSRGAVKDD